jgi:TnsA endonuclease N terminal/TnsA endonuclease C terminal
MSKRFQHTKISIERRIKLGFGTGELGYYKPWLRIQDFASLGRCHRIWDSRIKRMRHLFSDLEEKIFFLYWWSEKLLDIREQYPLLPQDETIAIADDLAVKHPTDSKTQYPTVLTTDFLLKKISSTGDIYLARTAKYQSALSNVRTLEKLEIERIYWQRRNVDWKIVTNENLPKQLFHNIKLIFPFFESKSLTPLKTSQIQLTTLWLTNKVMENQTCIRAISKQCDQEFDYPKGFSANIIFYLIANKLWKPNLETQKLVLRSSLIFPHEINNEFFEKTKKEG